MISQYKRSEVQDWGMERAFGLPHLLRLPILSSLLSYRVYFSDGDLNKFDITIALLMFRAAGLNNTRQIDSMKVKSKIVSLYWKSNQSTTRTVKT